MFNKEGVNLFKKNWRLRFEEDEDDCEIFNSLSNLKETEGGEIYSKLFFNEPTYLIDYLNDNHEFYLEDSWVESLNSFYELIHSRYENYKFDRTRPLLSPDEVYLDKEYITNLIEKKISTSFCFSRSSKIEVKEKEDFMNSPATKVTNEYLPQLGEKVVHLQHGIGIFNGLKQIKANNVVNECLEIEYLNESKVFVPINDISKVNKFHGPEDTKINQLGSKRWKKRKSEALKRTFDVAAELLEIKARRNNKEGFSYQYPVKEYDEFKKLFPYQETPDQIKTIEEVERDLNSKQLTDRLICGEVGFGKTEVALRASFIAAYNSKQVCLLVPTTLLAQQHYETFIERFKDFPIKIAKLSRDLSKKQRDLVIKDLKSGNIDIIIGTHALIQKQNEFKDLGLLIIDEEHRFGVKQKEKIVSMKEDVEILSLSATPIPRSMNLSLAKLKDLSIISTPPSNRISVKTFVHSYNENLIKEAIQRELLRGGQIYYLCNDLKVIEDRKQRLEENFPKQKVEIIHGQLKSRDIEERMINFLENKTQILVCSTIIESGIDISNANTLIVEDADMLGLAQLHQLRGRVGRGKKQAFAYFLRSKHIKNKSKSNKRLKALKDSNSLSAGFLLAMKDLEIRGAGEILGSNQSGICESIGIDLYLKLLNRATDFIERGVLDFEYLDRSEVEVDLGRSSYIPEEYVSEINIRLIFYNKIATATTLKDLKDIKIEMIDRFGLFPDELRSLFLEAEIRISSPENLKSVTFKGQKVMLKSSDKVETINLERFTKLDDKVNFLIENNL
ncbi:MAG: DEAD/DEAH box helicase [Pseudomonadota bacterium]|nr:DEAD/DEAH box helicase [Pseudomonadota bacterium]